MTVFASPDRARSRAATAVCLVILALAGVAVYANSLATPFVHDDGPGIVENPDVRTLWPEENGFLGAPGGVFSGRPLARLSFALNHAVGGYDVRGYHATNLAIHILAAMALFALVRQGLSGLPHESPTRHRATLLAFFSALLWLVHPVAVQAVTYITQRTASLAGLCFLVVMVAAVRGFASRRRALWHGAAVAAFFVGIGVKETIVGAPVMVLAWDHVYRGKRPVQAFRESPLLYGGLVAGWVALAVMILAGPTLTRSEHETGFGVLTYAASQPEVIWYYVSQSLWPNSLSLDYYGWPPATGPAGPLLYGLPLAVILAASLWAVKARRPWGLVGLWFFVTLGPSSSFVPLLNLAFLHRMYLALASVVILVVVGGFAVVHRGFSGRPAWPRALGAFMALVVAAAVALGWATINRNRDFSSSLAIWEDTLEKRPQNPRAHLNVGFFAAEAGDRDRAMEHYKQALVFKPGWSQALVNIGNMHMDRGRWEAAAQAYIQALDSDPGYLEIYLNLGSVLSRAGKPEQAVAWLEKALGEKPDFVEARINLANAHARAGRLEEALAEYRLVLEQKPEQATVRANASRVLTALGRPGEAIECLEQGAALAPDNPSLQLELANLCGGQGRWQKAADHYAVVTRLVPDQPGPYANLAVCLVRLGKSSEALAHARKALDLEPDNPRYKQLVDAIQSAP